jgi:uncharacterized protein YjaZ
MKKPGFGKTLKEVLISEGLATLYESNYNNNLPEYAKVKYSKKCAELAKSNYDKNINYVEWFTGGSKQKGIPQWFGYTYAYDLMKDYCKKSGKTPAQLVNEKVKIT